ncbi:MAG: hypothetical protein PHE48_00085 [Candidatus Daviesbacteria bacterium]|nr:hypothetical protein [Candidatus Daviesbacteria bacterium]
MVQRSPEITLYPNRVVNDPQILYRAIRYEFMTPPKIGARSLCRILLCTITERPDMVALYVGHPFPSVGTLTVMTKAEERARVEKEISDGLNNKRIVPATQELMFATTGQFVETVIAAVNDSNCPPAEKNSLFSSLAKLQP